MSFAQLLGGRLAAAPISWGICEAPGWGMQLSPERVLDEMHSLGIQATELGAIGWLPQDSSLLRELVGRFHLSVIGGFVPLVLHDASQRQAMLDAADVAAANLAAAGAECFVTAVVSSMSAWERPELSVAEREHVWTMLDELDERVARFGLRQVVHPHVDTLIETAAEFDEFLAKTSTSFTLDTGHLYLGGADPVALATNHADRIGLVHLKDVDRLAAADFLADQTTLMGAVQAGLFPSLGDGAVPIAATIDALIASGYSGWYVLEQDIALTDGVPEAGDGPLLGVRRSMEYLQSLDANRRQ